MMLVRSMSFLMVECLAVAMDDVFVLITPVTSWLQNGDWPVVVEEAMTDSVMNIVPLFGTLLSDLLREQHDFLLGLLGHACCLLVVGRQDVVP